MADLSLERFLVRLSAGGATADVLQHVGESDPRKAETALAQAARHPDLAGTIRDWAPAVLLCARPGFAAQCLEELAQRYRQTRGRALDVTAFPSLPALLGNSDFLARLLLRHPNWVEELAGALPAAPPDAPVEADWTAIRIAKYRGLLRIAARDLAGRDTQDSLEELSALADRCLRAGLERAASQEEEAPPALLALGKLGGSELNFSSDVDLLFVHEPDPRRDAHEEKERMARIVRTFKHHLEVRSEDGFAYRVDLNLRPEGRSGALVNSIDAALSYYESFGADWERQMLIRLRPVAGPESTAHAFAAAIEPFVFRRGIDFRAVRGVREMKARIELERTQAGRDLEADLKEGPGGIRDVEFFVQAFQLLHGGRIGGELRSGNVVRALTALRDHGIVPAATVEALREGYLWLRRAEHAGQLVEERQVHRFPRDPAGQLGLARRLGIQDLGADQARTRLLDDWVRVRAEVRRHFDALVLGAADA